MDETRVARLLADNAEQSFQDEIEKIRATLHRMVEDVDRARFRGPSRVNRAGEVVAALTSGLARCQLQTLVDIAAWADEYARKADALAAAETAVAE